MFDSVYNGEVAKGKADPNSRRLQRWVRENRRHPPREVIQRINRFGPRPGSEIKSDFSAYYQITCDVHEERRNFCRCPLVARLSETFMSDFYKGVSQQVVGWILICVLGFVAFCVWNVSLDLITARVSEKMPKVERSKEVRERR